MSRVLKLTVAYDGTAYVGWQRQAQGISIQGVLEDALSRIVGGSVGVTGAGRTDAGVHALGQVVRAAVTTRHDTSTLARALNATLPADVRVLAVQEAAETFHPRFHAVSKTYQYWIWNGPVLPPPVRPWCWHIPRTLDTAAMDRASRLLEGRHDFASFQSTGSDVKTTTRSVLHARVRRTGGVDTGHLVLARLGATEPALVVFEIAADGFLRHMVRTLAGTLVEVGTGRRPADSLTALLEARDRAASGPTAPAHGLVLVSVQYPDPGSLVPVP